MIWLTFIWNIPNWFILNAKTNLLYSWSPTNALYNKFTPSIYHHRHELAHHYTSPILGKSQYCLLIDRLSEYIFTHQQKFCLELCVMRVPKEIHILKLLKTKSLSKWILRYIWQTTREQKKEKSLITIFRYKHLSIVAKICRPHISQYNFTLGRNIYVETLSSPVIFIVNAFIISNKLIKIRFINLYFHFILFQSTAHDVNKLNFNVCKGVIHRRHSFSFWDIT